MYERFLELLQKKGVTVADVCKATGINQSTLSNWKTRRNLLSMKNAQKIADYFEVSVDYFMTGTLSPMESSSGKTYYFNDETAAAAQDRRRKTPETAYLLRFWGFCVVRAVEDSNSRPFGP